MTERWLTTAQVAEQIGVQPKTVMAWARSGRIKAVRLGRPGAQLRYTQAAVDAVKASFQPANA